MKNALLKPLAALLPTALMLLSPICSQAGDYHFADVNRDGEVSLIDVNTVIDVILGKAVEPPQDNKTFIVNGVPFTMVRVEGGMFTMGAADDDPDAFSDERPTRMVKVSDYYIGQTEVTQELWEAVMGTNPSVFTGPGNPVERVSWDDCKEFIRRLNTLTGQPFRLPTEAEWEFAARGGNKSGGYLYSGSNNLNEAGWWDGNHSTYTTLNVAQLAPNELGLYDMSGNVFEWCNDWHGGYPAPSITVSTGMILLEDIPVDGSSTSATISINGYQLSDDVYISISGDGFSVSPQYIRVGDINNKNVAVTVNYSGPRNQSAEGIITVRSKNAQDKTIYARYHCPSLEVFASNPLVLADIPADGYHTTQSVTIVGNNLSDDVYLEIMGDGFVVSPNRIASNDGHVDSEFTVSYLGESTDPDTATLIISTTGVPMQTIAVVAKKAIAESDTTVVDGELKLMIANNANQAYEGYVDVNPKGPGTGFYRIMRGGAWNSQSRFCRNSYRYSREPSFKHFSVGLRLAL